MLSTSEITSIAMRATKDADPNSQALIASYILNNLRDYLKKADDVAALKEVKDYAASIKKTLSEIEAINFKEI